MVITGSKDIQISIRAWQNVAVLFRQSCWPSFVGAIYNPKMIAIVLLQFFLSNFEMWRVVKHVKQET